MNLINNQKNDMEIFYYIIVTLPLALIIYIVYKFDKDCNNTINMEKAMLETDRVRQFEFEAKLKKLARDIKSSRTPKSVEQINSLYRRNE